MSTVDKLKDYFIQYGINIAAAILIFVLGKWLARITSKAAESFLLKAKVNKTLAYFTRHAIYFTVLAFVITAALNKLGVETNSFIALIGAAGLAVGFALQGSLSNFAAGVMIIIFEPFQVGDYIETAGAQGRVEEIQIFNTVISADKKRIIIPNSKVTSDKIIVSL